MFNLILRESGRSIAKGYKVGASTTGISTTTLSTHASGENYDPQFSYERDEKVP